MATPWLALSVVPHALNTPEQFHSDNAAMNTHEMIATAVQPAGPWTWALWRAGQDTTREIHENPFVQQLVEGSLLEHAIEFHLPQDALYLQQYARYPAALATASTAQTTPLIWAQSLLNILTDEAELHRNWFGR